MIWVDADNITELDYYHPTNLNVPCYCDLIMQPSDMYLQAQIGTESVSLTMGIEMYEADGVTFLYTVTADYYTFETVVDALGNRYVNIRFLRFPDFMCNNPCFILRVKIYRTRISQQFSSLRLIFDKFTQRYCLHDCCIVPSGITVETGQEGQLQEYSELDYSDEYYNVS